MPGVRAHQAERKFAIDLGTSVGGHGPFRGLDAPLALQTLYHGEVRKILVLSEVGSLFATQQETSAFT
jgi:hypothetical protein